MKKYTYIIIGIVVVASAVFLIVTPGKAGKLDAFAKCITAKKVTFYGAFWCPHCQAEKARFGKSAQYLPYKECSTPDSQGQTQVCKDAGITTYPTWEFPVGTPIANGTTTGTTLSTTTTRVVGEMELVDLAAKTGCELPTADAATQ